MREQGGSASYSRARARLRSGGPPAQVSGGAPRQNERRPFAENDRGAAAKWAARRRRAMAPGVPRTRVSVGGSASALVLPFHVTQDFSVPFVLRAALRTGERFLLLRGQLV